MEALSHTIQKLRPMLKYFVYKQTKKQKMEESYPKEQTQQNLVISLPNDKILD